jgi:hypothetical protein
MIRKSPLTGRIAALVAVMLLCMSHISVSQPSGGTTTTDASGYVGNAACAKSRTFAVSQNVVPDIV